MSAPVSKEFARLMSRANSAMVHERPADSRLTKAERARLARLLSEARKHVQRKRDSKLFEYCGARFRLMTFNGWLIVMAWNGRPLAGPVRIDRRCLTPSTNRAHDSPRLQTTGNGIGVPNSQADEPPQLSGFFTSFAWPPYERVVWGAARLTGPVTGTPTHTVPLTPIGVGERKTKPLHRSTSHA